VLFDESCKKGFGHSIYIFYAKQVLLIVQY